MELAEILRICRQLKYLAALTVHIMDMVVSIQNQCAYLDTFKHMLKHKTDIIAAVSFNQRMGTIAQKGCEFFEEADIDILPVDELPALADRVTDAADDTDRCMIQHDWCPEFAEIIACTAGFAGLADWIGDRIQYNCCLTCFKCMQSNMTIGSYIAHTAFHTAAAGDTHLLIISD